MEGDFQVAAKEKGVGPRQADVVAGGATRDLLRHQLDGGVEVILRFSRVAAVQPDTPLVEVGPRQPEDVARPVGVALVEVLELIFRLHVGVQGSPPIALVARGLRLVQAGPDPGLGFLSLAGLVRLPAYALTADHREYPKYPATDSSTANTASTATRRRSRCGRPAVAGR